nr:autophagy-related protein 9A isoform X1 [Parasteatoda tepidariorum]XP_042909653.1 autophagy-related protein 9A isoform X2 [Parasteatoda tepidariorum]
MNTFQTNYQSLENDEIETSPESVIVHVASEGSKSRWNHIDDLDSFFRKIYKFHQKHGFSCIVAEECIGILFAFLLLCGIFYLSHCVNFVFDEPPSPLVNRTDIQLSDLFIPLSECAASFSFGYWLLFVIFMLFIAGKCYKATRAIYSFKEIEQFYESALKISKNEINNVTWHEVQCRLREVQHEQQMCVHKSDLTELDIYHRVLRNKNYMVALVNKNILPLNLKLPYVGEWVYFSPTLEYNLELLFFGSLLSPFKGTGTLKEEYKKYSKRKEVAHQLGRNMLILGFLNLTLSPFIIVWRIISYIYTYSGSLRYEPSVFGTRKWSPYARVYLRHFNELDHELNARLGRAYKPAKEYMKSFSNPLVAIIANFLRSGFGFVAVFFLAWGIFKEPLFQIESTLLIITVASLAFCALSALIPDENAVFYPQHLMQRMVADIHYVPDHFKTLAHTSNVRDEFSHLFQYHITFVLEDLVGPLATAYILLVQLRPRTLEIVDFFRCFTVDVAGVGDVCSFALMDVSKHGNQQWVGPGHTKTDQVQQAEDGKTELSLIHFKMMNPHWVPPDPSNRFFDEFKEQVITARAAPGQMNAYYSSLNSLTTMGSKYASLVNSIHQSQHLPAGSTSMTLSSYNKDHLRMKGGLSHAEGPPYLVQDALPSLTTNEIDVHSVQELNPMELRAADMSLSALFLHEVCI